MTLFTPILLKDDPDLAVPADVPVHYLLASNGLFLCRRHELFESCVAARSWPRELAVQEEHVRLLLPPLPRALLERIVGFFLRIRELHGSEAAVLLYWNRTTRRYVPVVPPQTATMERGWRGHLHPVGVKYAPAVEQPPELILAGDVHSHVDSAAYASETDIQDEEFRTGLHVVVGRLQKDPPDLHAAMVVDGRRFDVHPDDVVEGYERPDLDVPRDWIEAVEVEVASRWAERPEGNGAATVAPAPDAGGDRGPRRGATGGGR